VRPRWCGPEWMVSDWDVALSARRCPCSWHWQTDRAVTTPATRRDSMIARPVLVAIVNRSSTTSGLSPGISRCPLTVVKDRYERILSAWGTLVVLPAGRRTTERSRFGGGCMPCRRWCVVRTAGRRHGGGRGGGGGGGGGGAPPVFSGLLFPCLGRTAGRGAKTGCLNTEPPGLD
jgi:hypothetical protein